MYETLVAALRNVSEYDSGYAKLMYDAADAIEALSKTEKTTKPHGRLIDADAYCEDLLKEAHKVWRLLKPETIERINRTIDDLKKYPAIIEAEGSEGHDD